MRILVQSEKCNIQNQFTTHAYNIKVDEWYRLHRDVMDTLNSKQILAANL